MFNFLKKRKVDYDINSDSNNNNIKNNVESNNVETKIDGMITKIAELQKNYKYDDAMAMTQELIKMANGLSEDEKAEVLTKFHKAMDEIDENDDDGDKSEMEKNEEKSELAVEIGLDEDDQDKKIKVDGSETARQNKIKEILIDPNPLYIKWYNYFWEHKLHEDAQAKKFCPRYYYVMYNRKHNIWNGIDLTENDWNMTVGCIYGDISPVLNFEAICTVGIRPEFTCLYAKLASLIDENKIRGLCTYVDFDKDALNKEFSTLTQDQLKSYDIRYNKCNLSIDSKKAQEYSSDSVFLLVKKWEAFCPSPIYDINPETDTEERYWERRNALIEVYNIFYKYNDYNKDLSKAFAIATEYFEFVEKHSN